MGKFMKKKGYGARKRRDFTKGNVNGRLCFKCKSPNHVMANSPHLDGDDDDNKKKKDKNERKEKKSKKMSFKKNKKGGGYIVTWDSDADDDEDSVMRRSWRP